MSEDFDPYYIWLAIPPDEQPPNLYRLLGVKLFESNSDVIAHAADARMAQVRNFQNGQRAARSQSRLNELAAARVCLLEHSRKQAYDRKLKTAKAAVASQNSSHRLPKASALPKFAEPLPANVSVSAAVTPEPLDFGFVAEPFVPSSHAARKQARKNGTVVLMLAVCATLIAGGIAAGAWFFSSSDKPTAGSSGLAQAVAPNPRVEEQSSEPPSPSSDQPVEGQALRLADAASPLSAPAPAAALPPVVVERRETLTGSAMQEASPAAVAQRISADPSNAPQTPDERHPLPTAAERKAALDLVVEVYKDDYAKAKKPAEKLALAEKLLKQADDETGTVQRFALLSEARSFALAGGGPQLLAEVVHQLATGFAIDEKKVLADSFEKLAEKAPAKTVLSELCEVALKESDEAAAADQYGHATRLANLALNAAKKTGQAETVRNIAARVKDLNELTRQHQAAQEAETRLAADPADADAHLALGKYLCFTKNDWDAGNPHLAKGSDPTLQALARKEIQSSTDAADQVKLADGWWELAEASKGASKLIFQSRAAWWYQQAQPQLGGLAKSRVEKRLQLLTDKPASVGKSPGKKTAKPTNRNVASKAPKEVYLYDLEPLDYCAEGGGKWRDRIVVNGVVSPHGIWLAPVTRSLPGHVGFTIGRNYRQLKGMVSIRDTTSASTSPLVFSVHGDGQVLWRSEPVQNRSHSQTFQVNVSGVDRLELFVATLDSNNYAHAVWCEPMLTSGR